MSDEEIKNVVNAVAIVIALCGLALALYYGGREFLRFHYRNMREHSFDGMRLGVADSTIVHRVVSPAWWQVHRQLFELKEARDRGLRTAKVRLTFLCDGENITQAFDVIEVENEAEFKDVRMARRARAKRKSR